MLANWVRKLARDFVEQTFTLEMMLKLITTFFTLLKKGTGLIPGTTDDELLSKWEASVNKQELAAAMQQYLLDLIIPALSKVRMMTGPEPTNVTLAELEAALPAITADVNQAIAA